MKKIALYLCCVALMAGFASCNDELDIKQNYSYHVSTLPLPKKIKKGDVVSLEFSITREGYYNGTKFKFRYFQSDGKGSLYDENGSVFSMNRFYGLPKDNFVFRYTSDCTEKQTLDFVFEDSFGQQVVHKIEFANDNANNQGKE